VKQSWVMGVTASFLMAHPSQPIRAFAEETSDFSKAYAAYEDRKLDEALAYAQKAVREQPTHVDVQALLGELYYQRQDLTQAKQSWEKALKLAPSRQDIRERLDKLNRESQVERDLSRSDTSPFVVRFARDQIPTSQGELRDILREVYRLIGQQVGYFPDHPITVLLYSEEEFNKVKGASHQAAGLYDGKIRLPLPVGEAAVWELKRVLWHEYTHALVHDLSRGRCPTWLNEGIATLQEARVQPLDLSVVKEALHQGKLYTWNQLWNRRYEEADLKLQYTQSHLIAAYLVKRWGWKPLAGLLNRLGQGYPIEDALQAEYRMASAAIEKEWLLWLKRTL